MECTVIKPLTLFSRVLGIVAVTEFIVMVILWHLDIPEGFTKFFLDSLFLSLASAPFLYLLVVRYMARKLEAMAYHDHLTGLPNRLLLIDRLNQALALGHRHRLCAAILFLDLDRFKDINDALGHEMGDELLKGVAERLRNCTRETDTIARLSGDEFTIILQDIKRAEDIAKVIEKLYSVLNVPFFLRGNELFLTVSIGVSIYPDDGKDAETLLKNADIAMYRAKNEGRGNYQLYSSSMNASSSERLKLENMLRRAVEKEEFFLHYQPQVDLNSGEIIGIEALVRWQEPERGVIPPGKFIPLAEDIGLIIPIGEWVIRTACTTNKIWQDKGLKPVNMAVNLSMRQFRQKDFVDTVAQILEETHLDPRYLEFELTESIIMEDVESTIEKLCKLKEMGIRLTIDDFGTGYSSLGYLRRMPLDMLKIAQCFVQDIALNPGSAAIATTIIRMAHSLDLGVIAEGVETAEQLTLLQTFQCDKIQGFLVSRPVPTEEIEEFLKKEWCFILK